MTDLVEEYLAILELEEKSQRTIRDTRRCLLRLHEDLPHGLAYACREQLQAWLAGPDDPQRRWSRATRRTYECLLRPFFAWLETQGLLPEGNPTAGMRRQRCPTPQARVVPEGVEAAAFQAVEPLLTAVYLARYQGLRRAECAGAERGDISEEETFIRDAKGGEPQTVPTHPIVWEHVRRRPPGLLIGFGPEQLGRLAAAHFQQHGLHDRVGLHDLRRLFALEIYDLDHDVVVVQECLRHARLETTRVYLGISRQRGRDAIRRIASKTHRPADDGPVPRAA